MENNHLILVEQYCIHYNIEISFIDSLQEYGLIKIAQVNDERYLHHDDLKEIEKMIQFYYDLGINLEGIEVISNLLQQIKELHYKLVAANNKMKVIDNNFLHYEL
jgi:hypothetical protein